MERGEELEDTGLESGAKTTRDGGPRRAAPLKLVALAALTLQTTTAVLSTRYARTRSGDMFVASTAVVSAEAVKLIACLAMVYLTESSSSSSPMSFASLLYDAVVVRPTDALDVCVPALVYLVQNNLVYAAASNLDAVTFQAVYQLKTLASAAFSAAMLKRELSVGQWAALAALVPGVALVQLNAESAAGGPSTARGTGQNRAVGFASALGAAVACGFAGVYLERILKGAADVSIWRRNVHLSSVSVPLGLAVCLAADWREIAGRGFFFGYDPLVVYLVCLQAAGGLIVSVVIKYADNILKGFATSLAIVVSCVFSVYFFHLAVGVRFVAGAVLVVFSALLYGRAAGEKKPTGAANPKV